VTFIAAFTIIFASPELEYAYVVGRRHTHRQRKNLQFCVSLVDCFDCAVAFVERILVMSLTRAENRSVATSLDYWHFLWLHLLSRRSSLTQGSVRWIFGLVSNDPHSWDHLELYVEFGQGHRNSARNCTRLVSAGTECDFVGKLVLLRIVYLQVAIGLEGANCNLVVEVGYTRRRHSRQSRFRGPYLHDCCAKASIRTGTKKRWTVPA